MTAPLAMDQISYAVKQLSHWKDGRKCYLHTLAEGQNPDYPGPKQRLKNGLPARSDSLLKPLEFFLCPSSCNASLSPYSKVFRFRLKIQ